MKYLLARLLHMLASRLMGGHRGRHPSYRRGDHHRRRSYNDHPNHEGYSRFLKNKHRRRGRDHDEYDH